MKNIVKVILGVYSFLASLAGLVVVYSWILTDYEYAAPETKSVFFLLPVSIIAIISYLILSKFWSKRTESDSQIDSEINLLRKQIEQEKLQKELNKLREDTNPKSKKGKLAQSA